MKKGIIIIIIFVSIILTAFISSVNNTPIKEQNIILANNEFYPIKDNPYPNELYSEYYEPYSWSDTLSISKNLLVSESPIILRSIETNSYSFDNLREYCLANIKDLSFPIYYERLGLNQSFSLKLSFEQDDEKFLIYTNNIFASKEARKELITYAVNSFKLVEKYFPNTWKQYIIKKIDDCLLFTKGYNVKRNYYTTLEKKRQGVLNKAYYEDQQGLSRWYKNSSEKIATPKSFVDEIGQFEAFIYRRIEHNKVPIQEIDSYLTLLKNNLLQTIKTDSYTNFKNIIINNGDIIISDKCINSDGAEVKIWNKSSNKHLLFKRFSRIKCLKNGDRNYYVVFYNNQNSLIDNNLNIVNTIGSPNSTSNNNVSSIENEKIKMTKKNGVYFVPTEVNGIPMEFIFDTGASSVSISMTEALFLKKNGKLSKDDIKGSQYFSDANGDISEGTKIILRKIKIGNKTLYNVEASVVHNLNAPLLIGQSALEKLGKIIFDPNNHTLSFE